MKNIQLAVALLPCLVLGACHNRNRVKLLPPLPPVQGDPAPAPASQIEPKLTQVAKFNPPPEPASENNPTPTQSQGPSVGQLLLCLTDAFFDYDQDRLRPDAQDALRTDSSVVKQILARQPDATLVLEGHADERGSAEYNLALGARRAEMAKDFLVNLGVPEKVLKTVSYGKERPQCTDETEKCWQKNRRAHLAPGE